MDVNSGGMTMLEFFAAGLTIMFVVLKFNGVIDWSWWWVFSPVILLTVLGIVLAGLFALGYYIFFDE